MLLTLTVLSMIVGELVPKSLALQDSTRTAMLTVLPMQWSLRLFSWAIAVLNGSGALLLKLLRAVQGTATSIRPGDRAADRREPRRRPPGARGTGRLHRALRLGLRNGEPADGAARAPAARRQHPDSGSPGHRDPEPFSRWPVYRGSLDDVVGMLHTKDLVTEYVTGMRRRSLASLLRPIDRVRHDMPADRLLAFLRERRTHQALVIDASGRVIGLITLEDVVAELLGGVADEFKMARRPAARPRDEEPR